MSKGGRSWLADDCSAVHPNDSTPIPASSSHCVAEPSAGIRLKHPTWEPFMPITRLALFAGLALASMLAIAPAHALTMKECSAKFSAAKEAGTLGDMKWNDF